MNIINITIIAILVLILITLLLINNVKTNITDNNTSKNITETSKTVTTQILNCPYVYKQGEYTVPYSVDMCGDIIDTKKIFDTCSSTNINNIISGRCNGIVIGTTIKQYLLLFKLDKPTSISSVTIMFPSTTQTDMWIYLSTDLYNTENLDYSILPRGNNKTQLNITDSSIQLDKLVLKFIIQQPIYNDAVNNFGIQQIYFTYRQSDIPTVTPYDLCDYQVKKDNRINCYSSVSNILSGFCNGWRPLIQPYKPMLYFNFINPSTISKVLITVNNSQPEFTNIININLLDSSFNKINYTGTILNNITTAQELILSSDNKNNIKEIYMVITPEQQNLFINIVKIEFIS